MIRKSHWIMTGQTKQLLHIHSESCCSVVIVFQCNAGYPLSVPEGSCPRPSYLRETEE